MVKHGFSGRDLSPYIFTINNLKLGAITAYLESFEKINLCTLPIRCRSGSPVTPIKYLHWFGFATKFHLTVTSIGKIAFTEYVVFLHLQYTWKILATLQSMLQQFLTS